jgi:hypothetical protein
VLFEALSSVKAYRRLHDVKLDEINAEGYLELAKAAGYSERAAQKAASAWAYERMVRELPQ